jgi:hypothetical protein
VSITITVEVWMLQTLLLRTTKLSRGKKEGDKDAEIN